MVYVSVCDIYYCKIVQYKAECHALVCVVLGGIQKVPTFFVTADLPRCLLVSNLHPLSDFKVYPTVHCKVFQVIFVNYFIRKDGYGQAHILIRW
jgi:hypothetical protein